MNLQDLWTLLPLLSVAVGIVVLLLLLAFRRDHTLTAALGVLILVVGIFTLVVTGGGPQVTPLVRMDGYAQFFIGLIYGAAAVVTLLLYRYLELTTHRPEEMYILLLLATLGSAVLVASTHFVSLFLGLEMLSVSLYVMLAYFRTRERGVEAGIKYLVLAGASSGFLLFGMALVYTVTGTMEFAGLTSVTPTASNVQNLLMLTGLAMLIVGIGFKLALVPFHLWTPDVYEGAPAPVTAFVATVSKGAMLALFLRLFVMSDMQVYRSIFLVLVLIALASMIIGNLLALLQSNVKRLLAYSSIAHMGYMLVAVLAGGPLAISAVAFYLVSYFVTTLGAFGTMTVLSNRDRDAEHIEDYDGLFQRRPGLALVMTAMLLSLAGIPLTSGFVGKFYLVAAGVGSAQWLLVLVLVVTSAVGLFYYLRIIVVMYSKSEEGLRQRDRSPLPVLGAALLAALVLILIWLGIWPTPVLDFITSHLRM